MIRVRRAPRHGDVAHDGEDARHLPARIGLGGPQALQVVAGADEAVLGLVRSRQDAGAVHPAPVGVEGQLLLEGRAVRHHLVGAVMMDDRLARDVLDHGGIAGGVADRQVDRRMAGAAGPEIRGDDVDRVRLHRIDDLGHGRIVREDVRDPGPHRDARLGALGRRPEIRLREIEQVGAEALFVDAVEGAVDRAARGHGAGGHHRPVLAGPDQAAGDALVLRAAGNDVEMGVEVIGPVHRPAGDHRPVVAQPGGSGTGVRDRGHGEGQGGRKGERGELHLQTPSRKQAITLCASRPGLKSPDAA